jgi:hypothetical protein
MSTAGQIATNNIEQSVSSVQCCSTDNCNSNAVRWVGWFGLAEQGAAACYVLSGYLSIALVKCLNAASHGHISAAGLDYRSCLPLVTRIVTPLALQAASYSVSSAASSISANLFAMIFASVAGLLLSKML